MSHVRSVALETTGWLILVAILLCYLSVSFALPSRETFSVHAIEQHSADGLHEIEQSSDGQAFRWTGRESHLRFSTLGIANHILSMTIAAPRPGSKRNADGQGEPTTTAARLTINHLPPLALQVPPTPRQYHVLVPTDQLMQTRNVVTLQSETFQPSRRTDTRALGIAMFAVQWQILKPLDLIPPLQNGSLLLVGVLSFVLLSLTLKRPAPPAWSWLIRVGLSAWLLFLTLSLGYLSPLVFERWRAGVLTAPLIGLLGLLLLARLLRQPWHQSRTLSRAYQSAWFSDDLEALTPNPSPWERGASEPPSLAGRRGQGDEGKALWFNQLVGVGGGVFLTFFLIGVLRWDIPRPIVWGLLLTIGGLCLLMVEHPLLSIRSAVWWLNVSHRYGWLLLAVFLFTSYFTIYLNCSTAPCRFTTYDSFPARSDGQGYYSYLPAALIDGDLTLQTYLARPEGEYYIHGVVYLPELEKPLLKFPMGVALLTIPFFLIGHILSLLYDQPLNGISLFYQLPSGLSGIVYTLLGLLVLKRLLVSYVSLPVALLTAACVVLCTNLYNYTVFDTMFSHPYSFFLITALLFLIPRWYEHPTYRTSILLGLVCGFLFLIRNANILAWIMIPLYGIVSREHIRQRITFLVGHTRQIGVVALVAALTMAPQLLYWWSITGSWVVNTYVYEGFFYYLRPFFGYVLFSSYRGLFVWVPILVLSVPGFWLMVRQRHPYRLVAPLYLVLITYMFASWHDPGFGASYGPRVYIDSLGVFALGLASTLEWLRQRITMTPLLIGATFLMIFSLNQTYKYWLAYIHPGYPGWDQVFSLLPWFKMLF